FGQFLFMTEHTFHFPVFLQIFQGCLAYQTFFVHIFLRNFNFSLASNIISESAKCVKRAVNCLRTQIYCDIVLSDKEVTAYETDQMAVRLGPFYKDVSGSAAGALWHQQQPAYVYHR